MPRWVLRCFATGRLCCKLTFWQSTATELIFFWHQEKEWSIKGRAGKRCKTDVSEKTQPRTFQCIYLTNALLKRLTWKVRPSIFQPLRLRPLSGAHQPCSDWLDARHLAIVLIHPSWQGFSSWAVFYAVSKFCVQISAVSKFFGQILALSKFDFRSQFFFIVSKFFSIWAICV
jgi:hypothetical protein